MLLFGELMACASVGAAGDVLARPSAPSFTVSKVDLQYLITVTALPVSWGDLATPGDGDGVLGHLEWWNALGGWQTLIDPADVGEFLKDLDPSLFGNVVISLRGVSAAGRTGIVATVREEVVTNLGEVVTHDGDPVTVFVGG